MDVADEQHELLAVVDLVGGARAVIGEVDVHRVDADRLDPSQVVEAAVARDPIQPRPDVDRSLVGEDRVERGGENLLEHVLGVLARAEQMPAEGEQPRLVAIHEQLERVLVAAADQRDEPLIGLQTEQRRAAVQPNPTGIFERRDFHRPCEASPSLVNEDTVAAQ